MPTLSKAVSTTLTARRCLSANSTGMKFLKRRLETSNHENTHNLKRFLIYGLITFASSLIEKNHPVFCRFLGCLNAEKNKQILIPINMNIFIFYQKNIIILIIYHEISIEFYSHSKPLQ
jgi:hypothetical protein